MSKVKKVDSGSATLTDGKPHVSSSNKFKCRNCGARSTNSGAFYKGSNVYKDGKHCYGCEKAWAKQDAEDNSWYNNVRM